MKTDPSARSIKRVVIVAKIRHAEGPRMAARIGDWLEQRGICVSYDQETAAALDRDDGADRDLLPRDTDLAIVAGGDGTLLSVARSAAPLDIPILGINFGSLGFLTELQPDEVFESLEDVIHGRYRVEQRETLRVRLHRDDYPDEEFALLNDAVITKSALARMIVIGVRIDGEDVVTYTSDGLIVSTPTGSTAYNLSAGGPILDPRMGAFVIAPICPHTLSNRPLVIPSSVTVDLSLQASAEEVFLTLDGQVGFPFHPGDRLTIDRHPNPVRLVRVAQRSFFDVLRRKLRWGAR